MNLFTSPIKLEQQLSYNGIVRIRNKEMYVPGTELTLNGWEQYCCSSLCYFYLMLSFSLKLSYFSLCKDKDLILNFHFGTG